MKKKGFLVWYKNWRKSVRKIMMQVRVIKSCKHNVPRAFVTKIVVMPDKRVVNEKGSVCIACGRIISVIRIYAIVSFNKGEG